MYGLIGKWDSHSRRHVRLRRFYASRWPAYKFSFCDLFPRRCLARQRFTCLRNFPGGRVARKVLAT